MIRITKPDNPPRILIDKGKKRAAALKGSYTRYRAEYESGARSFSFDRDIYAHETVKQSLINAQHGKCCFCESKLTHISYGDVEHFRPKAGHCQSDDEEIMKPGYYWLAYSWDNLFLSCQLCNQRHKRNLFPLADRAGRAISHIHDLGLEAPLFIDPGTEDPEQFISFREEAPYAIGDNSRGKETLEGLALRRKELREVRRDRYEELKAYYEITQLAEGQPENDEWQALSRLAQAKLSKAVESSAEYASMARAAIRCGFSIEPPDPPKG
jgi:uncharacterized protein (TIGR02646 family)